MAKKNMKKSRNNADTNMLVVPRSIAFSGDVVVKRMTLHGTLSTVAATGYIFDASTFTTGYVESAPATEWASFAARYQQYRVRSFSVTFLPNFNTSDTAIAGNIPLVHLAISDYIGATAPTTIAQIIADERAVVRSAGGGAFAYEADWSRNPNAKLWNTTNSGALPTANQYGIACGSFNSVSLGGSSLPYYDYVIAWDVELRGSQ
jgi:hypothetical protein